jgi:hypothetical protein
MNLFGGIKTVEEIVAPLKDTLVKLTGAVKEREQAVQKNEQEISRLASENDSHKGEIEHADRISKKISELLQ